MKKSIFDKRMLYLFIIILILSAVYIYILAKKKLPNQDLYIRNHQITAEVADSTFHRIRGLSYRRSLAPNHGMLFVFDRYLQPTFWMKGMNFSIDIIWIRDDEIVGIEKGVWPDGGLMKYRPLTEINRVLEVPAGTATIYHWQAGDKVEGI